MGLSATIQHASEDDDLAAVKAAIATHQNHLNSRLDLAIRDGSLETIKALLGHGAKLGQLSLYAVFKRDDPSLLQLLVDSGWDVNSMELRRPAIQQVPLL
jgi:hypothetical protein